jgi:hypothetical protein
LSDPDLGLPGPRHARRRAALRQYAGDVDATRRDATMPPRRRAAARDDRAYVMGMDAALERLGRADGRMGEPCRRVVRRVAVHADSLELAAAELRHDGPEVVRALLAAAADVCVEVYEVLDNVRLSS